MRPSPAPPPSLRPLRSRRRSFLGRLHQRQGNLAYINDKFMPSWLQSLVGKTEEEKTEAMKQTLEAITNMETAFKECSKGKPFFGGDTVGYLDISLGSQLGWIRAAEAMYVG